MGRSSVAEGDPAPNGLVVARLPIGPENITLHPALDVSTKHRGGILELLYGALPRKVAKFAR